MRGRPPGRRTRPSTAGRSTCRRRAARWSHDRNRSRAPRRSARRPATHWAGSACRRGPASPACASAPRLHAPGFELRRGVGIGHGRSPFGKTQGRQGSRITSWVHQVLRIERKRLMARIVSKLDLAAIVGPELRRPSSGRCRALGRDRAAMGHDHVVDRAADGVGMGHEAASCPSRGRRLAVEVDVAVADMAERHRPWHSGSAFFHGRKAPSS